MTSSHSHLMIYNGNLVTTLRNGIESKINSGDMKNDRHYKVAFVNIGKSR
jgi:hypothetical protein